MGVAGELDEIALDAGGAVLGDVGGQVSQVCVRHGDHGTRVVGPV